MSSFEWMELDTLTRQIEHAQSRIDAARATKNLGLVTVLQREIEQTAERRARVLADLTKALGSSGTAKRHSPAVQAQPETRLSTSLMSKPGRWRIVNQAHRRVPVRPNPFSQSPKKKELQQCGIN